MTHMDDFAWHIKIDMLTEEVTALLSSAMHQACHPVDESELDPVPGQPNDSAWLDTMAVSAWRDIGDWLTQHAGWQKHPNGRGRRQFYRPPSSDPARIVFIREDNEE